MEFRNIELEDRELFRSRLMTGGLGSCEDTFSNMYLWSRMYPLEHAVSAGGMLVVRSLLKDRSFRFPSGPANGLKETVEEMMEEAERENVPFQMAVVTPAQFELLEKEMPGRFQIRCSRDWADYVYEREKLANLSGKKMHGKKNHVNKFMRMYPDWKYEPITQENMPECFELAVEWRSSREADVEAEEEMRMEVAVTMNALRLREELGLRGGLLRASGKVVAFSLGEPASKDMFVVHIEKALSSVEGAYSMINQQFVLHETEGYEWINREDDSGEEGLRKAKLSYHPAFLIEKGLVTLKN